MVDNNDNQSFASEDHQRMPPLREIYHDALPQQPPLQAQLGEDNSVTYTHHEHTVSQNGNISFVSDEAAQAPLHYMHSGDDPNSHENINQQQSQHGNVQVEMKGNEPNHHYYSTTGDMSGNHLQSSLPQHSNYHGNENNNMEIDINQADANSNRNTNSNSNSNIQQTGKKTTHIPGLKREKINLNIGRIWNSVLPVRDKLYNIVESFPLDNRNSNIGSSDHHLLKMMEKTKQKSKFAMISSRLNNEKEWSAFSILASIESELKLLLDLNSAALQILNNSHIFILDNHNHKSELVKVEKMLMTRMDATTQCIQNIRGMMRDANLVGVQEKLTKNDLIGDATTLESASTTTTNNYSLSLSTRKRQLSDSNISDLLDLPLNDGEVKKKRSGSVGKRWKKRQKKKSNEVTFKESNEEQQLEEKKPLVKIRDEFPDRVTNPLLEMPYYQAVPKGFASSGSLPPAESIPQGAEYWKTMPLYFPIPDTFPLAYIGRILGFDASLANEIIENGDNEDIDISSLLLKECKDDKWKQVPKEGKFSDHLQFLRGQQIKAHSLPFDEIDPMWKALIDQYRGFREDLYKPSIDVNSSYVMPSHCIDFAKRLELYNEKITFRRAKLDDVVSLIKLSSVSF